MGGPTESAPFPPEWTDVAGWQREIVRIWFGLDRRSNRRRAEDFGRSHNWHHGVAFPLDPVHMDRFDKGLHANGTLRDLLWAASTPAALPASEVWVANLRAADPYSSSPDRNRIQRPSWLWLRTTGVAPSAAQVNWGPCTVIVEVDPGLGTLLTTPISVANPAVHVRMLAPGWADFGRGRPPKALGIREERAIPNMTFAKADNWAAWAVVTTLRQLSRRVPRWKDSLVDATNNQEFVSAALDNDDRYEPYRPLDLTSIDDLPLLGTATFRTGGGPGTVREGRRWSRTQAVARIADLDPDHPITEAQLRRFEKLGKSTVPLLRARLDLVYEAGGALGPDVVGTFEPGDGAANVQFPTWWIGPVWLRFVHSASSPSARGDGWPGYTLVGADGSLGASESERMPVSRAKAVAHAPHLGDPSGEGAGGPAIAATCLQWWPWQRDLVVCHGRVVTCRRASTEQRDLVIRLPTGWQVEAGLGNHPDAVDVNHNWIGMDDAAKIRIARKGITMYAQVFGRTWADTRARVLGRSGRKRPVKTAVGQDL